MLVVLNSIILLFFKVMLPAITRHGQFITVPNLKGFSWNEVETCLTQRNLRFEVTEDFAYSPDYPPRAVLQQYPKEGASVKEGRKIYLTLNTTTPPEVSMPHLVDGSVRNAHMLLKSQGLLLGAIKYVPDIAQNAVLEQWHDGKKIQPGTPIAKGSSIELVVGAGLGQKTVEVPNVIGMKLADAEFFLLSAGVKVGSTTYQTVGNGSPNTVSRQVPAASQEVRIGETVDLWLVALQEEDMAMPDSTSPSGELHH